MTIALQLPRLRPDQWEIAIHPAKVKVLSMGRRWGKTVLGGVLSLATASQGGKVAWIVPTYKNGRSLWRWAETMTAGPRISKRATANKTERIIEFSNGGLFGIFSADNEDSIRGEAFHLAILDEAARIPETAWTDAIQPTLADYDGDAILISTPKGLNWFHSEWVRGRDDMNYQASWIAPSSANPMQQIRNAAALAETRVTSRTYRQEWLAEFIADGAYFRNVENAAVIDAQDEPGQHEDHYLTAGIDLAKYGDFTVVTIACRECNRVVAWDRFNQMDYSMQVQRIKALLELFKVQNAIIDATGVGDPVVEMLQQELYS